MLDLLENPGRRELIARFARPAPLPGGYEPEQRGRQVYGGVGWAGHLELDKAFGHDRSGPRFYYLDGDLEIMSTSEEHERIKEWIGGCVDDYLIEQGIPNMPRGQATMRLAEQTGAEPDESWCLGEEKLLPDIVLENRAEQRRVAEARNLWPLPGPGGLDVAARAIGNSWPARGHRRLRASGSEPAVAGVPHCRPGSGSGGARCREGTPRVPRGAVRFPTGCTLFRRPQSRRSGPIVRRPDPYFFLTTGSRNDLSAFDACARSSGSLSLAALS